MVPGLIEHLELILCRHSVLCYHGNSTQINQKFKFYFVGFLVQLVQQSFWCLYCMEIAHLSLLLLLLPSSTLLRVLFITINPCIMPSYMPMCNVITHCLSPILDTVMSTQLGKNARYLFPPHHGQAHLHCHFHNTKFLAENAEAIETHCHPLNPARLVLSGPIFLSYTHHVYLPGADIIEQLTISDT